MHQRFRRVLFLVFLTIFLVGAPLVVLYTAGYQLNFTTWRVQQTGVIAISTFPKGATVSIDGVSTENKTPYVIQHLSPGSYTIALDRDGYQPWEERIDVQSGETTYVTATLFANARPGLLNPITAIAAVGERDGRYVDLLVTNTDGTQSITRFDTVTEITRTLTTLSEEFSTMTVSADDSLLILTNGTTRIGVSVIDGNILTGDALAEAEDLLPTYRFIDNGVNTEFKNVSTNTLITLLPPSTYTIAYVSPAFALFHDSRDRTYLFSLSDQTVTQVDVPTNIITLSESEGLLVGSDGNEIDIYNPETGETTLLARQSERILSLGWHNNGQAVLCASGKEIFAIAREQYETREITMLVENASILGMWPDTTGTKVTFYGTIDGITGLWSLALTQ